MCGRFTLRNPSQAYEAYLRKKGSWATGPRFNVAPGQKVPIIWRKSDENWEIDELLWGFIPRWAKPDQKPAPVINARSETVASKPAFRSAFRERRCLVPADGFYEWRKANSRRQPHFFRLRGDGPFALAGLWEEWRPKSGEPIRTFCVLTTEANPLLARVHDRMPVILDPPSAIRWLETPSNEAGSTLQSLLRPFPANEMEETVVDAWVNKVEHEGPRCLEPPAGAEQLELL